ncbi:hypothetical protein HDU93_009200 [Gonapodya sp. JEL0774]|nr:hypothetical protein HDU93_009200 [Gonapodya sp. JEL0774]
MPFSLVSELSETTSSFTLPSTPSLRRLSQHSPPPSQHQSTTLALLPAEVLLLIGEYLVCRLGLPTDALNRHLALVFGTPNNVAVRAIRRYESPLEAVVWECLNSSSGSDHRVVEAICERGGLLGSTAGDPNCKLDGTITLHRNPRKYPFTTLAPLRAAIKAGNPVVVRYLLDQGSTVDPSDPGLILTPLALASAEGNTEIVAMLLARGANIHLRKDIALRMASRHGKVEIVRLLLAKGANVEGDGGHGTALCEAAEFGSLEVVLELLGQGAKLHASNDYPLVAAIHQGHTDIVRLLLSRGATISAKNTDVICEAARAGLLETVSLLLDYGADINALGGRPLTNAVSERHLNVVSFLLQKGADVQLSENQALWEAVSRGLTGVVGELLTLGADPAAPSLHKRAAVNRARAHAFEDSLKLIGVGHWHS